MAAVVHPDGESAPSPSDRSWLVATALVGLLATLPLLVHSYLPMTDLPLHVLEVAIWAEPEGAPTGFFQWYESAGAWLPYWTTTVLAGLASPLLGPDLATRSVLALYALFLPILGGAAARAFGRSGWWGVPLAAFFIESNLAWGLLAWCVSGALMLATMVLVARVERGERVRAGFVGLGAVSLVLGWTHPQMAVGTWGLVGLLQVARVATRRDGWRRGAAVVATSTLSLVPTAVWFSSPARAEEAFGGVPSFAGAGLALHHLLDNSVDVWPGTVERWCLLLFVGLVLGSWARASRPSLEQLRPNLLVALVLGVYFVSPWNWNGQSIAQRLPYIVLLLLPCCAAPGVVASRTLRFGLLGIALLGLVNSAAHIRQFDAEAAATLEPLAEVTPVGARLFPAVYSPHSYAARIPALLHAGAWITARKGGVYGFHYNRLTSHHRPVVPTEQTLKGPDYFWSGSLAAGGELLVVDPSTLAFWDTVLARYPEDYQPVLPLGWPPDEVGFMQVGSWALITREGGTSP